MKKTIFLTILFLSIFFLPTISKAAETVDITFKFKATNTKEGFDHLSKLVVYCDNKKIGESEKKLQSKSNSITVKMPTGNHTLKAVLNAINDAGNWEERTIANDYSLDFVYEKKDNWKTNKTIILTFDIAEEEVYIDEKNNNTTSTTTTNTEFTKGTNYTATLKKINDFLKTFDDGYYGYLEIKNGVLYDRYKSGKYSKISMSDFSTVTEESSKKVVINCKNGKECVYSTYTDSYHTTLSFSQTDEFNTSKLIGYFYELKNAYNGTGSDSESIKNNRDKAANARKAK